MIFIVANAWDEKPCEEAKEIEVDDWDQRTFKTYAEHDARFPNSPWVATGSEHGINSIGIFKRVGKKKVWIIEFLDLNDLAVLITKYNKITLRPAYNERYPTLTVG